MGTSYMTFQKSTQFSWKELLSRIKQTHGQVNANLSSTFDLENMVVPSPPLLLVELRCDIKEGQTHFSPCKTMFYGEETKLGIHEE